MSFILSSVSGNLISAASAGYAPTNSADVSAIASAYQVVSATATQLYAGTSYLTGVNAAPISAERAGQAANASLATSAWYDGTGRFISALPDEAAVSAIASAYSESAASSKQDTLAFAYNTADQISSINGSALGGMDEAAVSGIASAYAQSAASSKLDTSAFSAVSGTFLTAHQDLSDYQTISGMTAYQPTSAMTAYQVSGDYAFNSSLSSKLDASASSSFYGSDNPSGFITGVDLSPYQTTADMSGYIPTSMSSDFQQVTGMSSYALSADVSATVDLVGTQSANWGGSALALSAGPGVKLEKVGNTLVASTDRTLLWSGDIIADQIAQLSEPHTSFEMLEIHHSFEGSSVNRPVISYIQCGYAHTVGDIKVIGVVGPALSLKPWESNNIYEAFGCYVTNTSATNDDQIRLRGAKVLMNGGISNTENLYHCYAIYGINRTAEA